MEFYKKAVSFIKSKLGSKQYSIDRVRECRSLFNVINKSRLRTLELETKSKISISFKSLYKNIDKYINVLKKNSTKLQSDSHLNPSSFESSLFEVNLDDFLISDDGYYINENIYLENFVLTVIDYCDSLLIWESKESEYKHNLRMSLLVIDNLIEIGKVFKSLNSIRNK